MSHDETYDAIVARLSTAKKTGLTIAELRELDDGLSDRQLRYRLDTLRQKGIVARTGKGRATRYRLTVEALAETEQDDQDVSVENHHITAPFLEKSISALSLLEVPVSSRPIAHYDAQWMTQLAKSSMLSGDTRRHLHQIGATGLEHDVAGTYIRHINERLLIDLSWASSALEGNTYSLLDTRELIERGVAAQGKDRIETAMILNHKRAIEFLMGAVEYGLTRMVASNLHATLMEDLLHDARDLGAIRSRPVRISMSTYIPLELPSALREELERILAFARDLEDPFETSLFLLVMIPYLQPFVDGNKRTARLLANQPLFEHNVRPLSFVDVEREDYLRATLCAYEQCDARPLRDLFIHAYERSCARYPAIREVVPEPDPFRLAHRESIYEVVREVITHPDQDPTQLAEAHASKLFDVLDERIKFIAIVLSDLDALHEGNFMRYHVSPSQFTQWQTRREESK